MFSYSTHLTLVWILWSYIKNATFSKSLFINMFHFTHRWKFVKWNIHDVIAKPRLEKTKKNYSLLILDAKHTKPSLLGSILLMCSTELRNMLTWIRITLRTVSSLPKHGHTMKQCRSNRILVIFVYIKQCLIYFFLFHISLCFGTLRYLSTWALHTLRETWFKLCLPMQKEEWSSDRSVSFRWT